MSIKQKSTDKPTWSMLKRSLIGLDQKELLALVRDLYGASRDNQAFLHDGAIQVRRIEQ